MTEFPHADFTAERETGITSATLRNWFVSLGNTDAERADIAAWIDSRMKRPGRPKATGRPSTAALQGACLLRSENSSPGQARAEFLDRLTDKQIEAALGKNPNGRIKKEYSAKKLLAEFSS